MATDVEGIYEQHLKPLPPADRLKLIALLAQELSETKTSSEPPRSLLELEGLGAEIWEGVDAQEYTNELRREWDHRP
jgi:hypothetical protein